uniref:Uncharacterized protein n=1 Tax=Arundo donax TaxID=35708 RepID=A0A0A9B4K2_ARUDO
MLGQPRLIKPCGIVDAKQIDPCGR